MWTWIKDAVSWKWNMDMSALIFIWETICEVGEAWLVIGGITLMVVYINYKEKKND